MPGIYHKDEKAYIHTKNLMYMNIHRSFICNSQNLKTQMSLNVGNKCWSVHTMEYYSAMEKNKLLIHSTLGWISRELY